MKYERDSANKSEQTIRVTEVRGEGCFFARANLLSPISVPEYPLHDRKGKLALLIGIAVATNRCENTIRSCHEESKI